MGKRGPQPQEGKRMKNGRLSRKPADVTKRLAGALEKDEREMLRAGVEARIRMHGLAPEASRDQRAGSFVGRLCMSGEISVIQHDAAQTFLEDYRNNMIAIHAPRAPSGVDLNRVQGGSATAENVEFYRRSVKRWRDAVEAIQAHQNVLRGQGALYAALETCILKDAECHHLVGWLREGLNTLVRHYGLVDKAKAA